MMVNNAPQHR